MALRVWLPLNGNINNYGASNLVFRNIASSNTTSNSSGKMGSCYYNNSNTAGGLVSDKTISLGQKQSMCCWMKFVNLTDNSSLGGSMVSQHRYPSNAGMGLTIKYISSTTGYLSVNTGNGSSRTYNTYCGTTLLQANTWYHVAYTYDGSNIRLYVNGNLEATHAYTGMSVPADYISVFCWSFGSDSGSGIHPNYKLYGYLNDVRVYDHTLSPKEIKEIARGLVIHYKLENTVPLRTVQFDKTIYTEPDGSQWLRIAHHNNPASALFASTDRFAEGVYKDANRWFDVYGICKCLKTFEFMVKQKTTSDASEVKYRWRQNKSPLVSVYSDVAPSAVTRITTSGYTDGGYGGLYILNSNTHMVIANTSNGNWFGAFGSWGTYNGGIPGYPNTAITTGYMDLYVKISDWANTTIYDCSGFRYNGTLTGTKSATTNSGRYQTALYLSQSDGAILIGNLASIVPEGVFTFNIWFKKNAGEWSSKAWETIFGGPSGFELEGRISSASYNYIHPYSWGGGSTSTPNSYSFEYSTGVWHMLTMVRTASDTKYYLDGVLKVTGTAGTIPSGNYYIGAWRDNASQNYRGYFSDARIYTTALSAADIKELYDTAMSIDKNGIVYARELVE